MRRLRPSSEAEMIALFLRTELASARFQDGLQALLARAGQPERVVTDPNLDDRDENHARRQLLTWHREYGTRSGLFNGFPDDVRWEWAAITPAELATVRYIDYSYWVELSGGTRLATDAAPRIRAGAAPFGVRSDWLPAMAAAVADAARFPPLILVTAEPRSDADLVVLEGHARLTAFMLRSDRLPPELEVLVGSSPTMSRWGLW
ncbi:hypothetical protein ACIBL5_36095 [Streptomyces sp. NPDC050516]|uniref:hypothetical protein n=1 Tax=Streptomyces sp. NPDC050516 TaxID=3365621 RepID=UPI0037B5A9C8